MLNRNRWFKLRPHPIQTKVLLSKKRKKAVVAGRGSGKTEIARRYFVAESQVKKPWPDPRILYTLPTHEQAKEVAWKPIKGLLPQEQIKFKDENNMTIELYNGCVIKVSGTEKPHRLEGVQYDLIISDESSDQKPKIYDVNLGPAMTHRKCKLWRIGVPKRRGVGGADFKAFFDLGMAGHPEIDSFTWTTDTVVDPEEVKKAKEFLASEDYKEQYHATWQGATGKIYYAFDEEENVSDTAIYHPGKPIIVGMDFNVSPMSWVLCHYIDNKFYAFDTIYEKDSNTRKSLDVLYKLYGQHLGKWVFIGDATSRSRKTSSSTTDYAIIQNDMRFKGKEVLFPKSNPPVVDRWANVNRLLCSSDYVRSVYINPKCKELIADFDLYTYKEGSNEPNTVKNTLGHLTDAFGYAMNVISPMRYNKPNNGGVIYIT